MAGSLKCVENTTVLAQLRGRASTTMAFAAGLIDLNGNKTSMHSFRVTSGRPTSTSEKDYALETLSLGAHAHVLLHMGRSDVFMMLLMRATVEPRNLPSLVLKELSGSVDGASSQKMAWLSPIRMKTLR